MKNSKWSNWTHDLKIFNKIEDILKSKIADRNQAPLTILYIFETRWTLLIISSHYSKPKISNGTAIWTVRKTDVQIPTLIIIKVDPSSTGPKINLWKWSHPRTETVRLYLYPWLTDQIFQFNNIFVNFSFTSLQLNGRCRRPSQSVSIPNLIWKSISVLFQHMYKLIRRVRSLFSIENYGPTTQKITFLGSPGPSHFILEITVGKGRIRHRPTLNFNAVIFDRF